jgi:hypothetical protein
MSQKLVLKLDFFIKFQAFVLILQLYHKRSSKQLHVFASWHILNTKRWIGLVFIRLYGLVALPNHAIHHNSSHRVKPNAHANGHSSISQRCRKAVRIGSSTSNHASASLYSIPIDFRQGNRSNLLGLASRRMWPGRVVFILRSWKVPTCIRM